MANINPMISITLDMDILNNPIRWRVLAWEKTTNSNQNMLSMGKTFFIFKDTNRTKGNVYHTNSDAEKQEWSHYYQTKYTAKENNVTRDRFTEYLNNGNHTK